MGQTVVASKDRSSFLWSLAAALAIILFFAEKTPIWTTLLLALLFIVLFHPVAQIPWIRNSIKRQIIALGFMTLFVVCFGFAVWPKANKDATGAVYAFSAAMALANVLLRLLNKPMVQHGLCVIFGMLSLALLQQVAHEIEFRQKINIGIRGGVKGFLDYKMQAENGMNIFPSKLNEISNIVANVGNSLERHTKRVKNVSDSSARMQLQRVSKTARMLDRYSRQIDKKGINLEAIAGPLAEGLEEWLKWASKQPNGWGTKQELEGSMRPFVETMIKALESTNVYIESLQAIHGVSRDMNGAIDRHIDSITRIRNTNEKMVRSCSEVLRHFEAIGTEQRDLE